MFLLRHGQSFFNLHFNRTRTDPGIEDPELTPLGIEQAQAAALELESSALTRIIVSPYTRTLQTAQPFLRMGVPFDIMHEVRERAAYTCDIGSSPARLAERFPHHDFTHLPAQWWHAGVETEQATLARADAFREAVAARGDGASTLLISHWAFILALTGRSVGNGELLEYDPAESAPQTIDWES
jgi:glucosyl-3-phosphoglycerate phosphatase